MIATLCVSGLIIPSRGLAVDCPLHGLRLSCSLSVLKAMMEFSSFENFWAEPSFELEIY
jgi:hypothetical protein